MARERLETYPKEEAALDALAEAAFASNDVPGYESYQRERIDAGDARSDHFNAAAWTALFLRPVGMREILWARRAVELSQRRSYEDLHTLASLYAETGRLAEARDTLREAMDVAHEAMPSSSDYYVLGRIAEGCGLKDIAFTYYKRVRRLSKDAGPTTTYLLARHRIAKLGRQVLEKPEL